MSVYRCAMCEDYKDADVHGCEEHPNDECECICEDCYNELGDCDLERQFEILMGI
jgi:hypothetical protein